MKQFEPYFKISTTPGDDTVLVYKRKHHTDNELRVEYMVPGCALIHDPTTSGDAYCHVVYSKTNHFVTVTTPGDYVFDHRVKFLIQKICETVNGYHEFINISVVKITPRAIPTTYDLAEYFEREFTNITPESHAETLQWLRGRSSPILPMEIIWKIILINFNPHTATIEELLDVSKAFSLLGNLSLRDSAYEIAKHVKSVAYLHVSDNLYYTCRQSWIPPGYEVVRIFSLHSHCNTCGLYRFGTRKILHPIPEKLTKDIWKKFMLKNPANNYCSRKLIIQRNMGAQETIHYISNIINVNDTHDKKISVIMRLAGLHRDISFE